MMMRFFRRCSLFMVALVGAWLACLVFGKGCAALGSRRCGGNIPAGPLIVTLPIFGPLVFLMLLFKRPPITPRLFFGLRRSFLLIGSLRRLRPAFANLISRPDPYTPLIVYS